MEDCTKCIVVNGQKTCSGLCDPQEKEIKINKLLEKLDEFKFNKIDDTTIKDYQQNKGNHKSDDQ